jgi:hypothetical protein
MHRRKTGINLSRLRLCGMAAAWQGGGVLLMPALHDFPIPLRQRVERRDRATCKLHEFLFHGGNNISMKPAVPSAVPYPDMRNW